MLLQDNVFTLKKFWGDDQFTSFDPEMIWLWII